MKQLVIFTDLDGTLLNDSTYSFNAALPALNLIRRKKIPLIFCSSKTKTEIEHYRKKLDNDHPFISENGGGIFIPSDYFKFQIADLGFKTDQTMGYDIIKLGARYSDLRKAVQELQQEGFDLQGFGDMSVEEVARLAHMDLYEAAMAKERDCDEPFVFGGSDRDMQRLFDAIKTKGFNYTRGRFFHILGKSDKGKAVSILMELYRKKLGEIVSIAIGDNPNDIPMLERVDNPIVVRKSDGSYDPDIDVPNLVRAGGIGPAGWNAAVLYLVKSG